MQGSKKASIWLGLFLGVAESGLPAASSHDTEEALSSIPLLLRAPFLSDSMAYDLI